MDSDALPKRRASARRTSSRQPGTIRTKSKPLDAASQKPSTPSFSDDQSLTSFPSLSPSLENSPKSATENLLERSPTIGERITATQHATSRIPTALDGLFEPAGSPQMRPNLFEDAPAQPKDVPGTIHHQSDQQIEHLISRVGAVKLVKQLSEDLAQRDVQVTNIQRRAEERERLLRKMLRECEVSNLDVESRLRELDRTRLAENSQSLLHATSSGRRREVSNSSSKINDYMSEALSETIGSQDEESLGSDSRAGFEEVQAANSHKDAPTPHAFSTQVESNGSRQKAGTVRTWKDYFKYSGSQVKPVSARPNLQSALDDPLDAKSTGRPAQLIAARQRLSSDMFRAPSMERKPSATASLQEHLLSVDKPRDQSPSAHSARSSASVSSWASRLIGGSARTKPDAGHRSKAASISGDAKATQESMRKQALRGQSQGLGTKSPSDRVQHNRAGSLTSVGPNGTIKMSNPSDALKSAASQLMPGSPHGSVDSGLSNMANLGPVEMDAILPDDDSRPPALSLNQNLQGSDGLLTDRFGFIFNNNRRKRQSEAIQPALTSEDGSDAFEALTRLTGVSSNDETIVRAETSMNPPRPGSPLSLSEDSGVDAKAWSEHLSISNMAGELLSHTPASAPMTSILTSDMPLETSRPALITMSKRGSEPAAGLVTVPSATRISSEHAELAPPSLTSGNATPEDEPKAPQDPIKALLEHLTSVHDGLQKDKEARWNEFLRKVRAERSRTGDGTSKDRRHRGFNMPESLIADGELVGVAGLGNRGKLGRAKWAEFRYLVLGGIPTSLRAKIWAECSGASSIRVPGYYEELVNRVDDDESTAQQIQMDITRTLTDNVYFRQGHGIQRLNEVLLAYSKRNPDIGYCQGMNLIAANFLLIMPTAEDAFWVLVALIEYILPEKYYDSSLLASKADQTVLREYVREIMPPLSRHFESLSVELEAFSFQWFLSVFTDCLSAEALFRVWDVVLCLTDGSTFIFQVALALLKLNEKQLIAATSTAEVYAYISQHMTDHAISIDALIRASEGLKKVVKREDVIARRKDAIGRELEQIAQRDEIRKERIESVKQKREMEAAAAVAETDAASSSDTGTPAADQDGSQDDEALSPLTQVTPRPEDDD